MSQTTNDGTSLFDPFGIMGNLKQARDVQLEAWSKFMIDLVSSDEYARATGRALSSFQGDQQPGLLTGWHLERMVLSPDRDVLRERIARRFAAMFESGAVEEVKALRALDLDPSLPAMKAIGVREISDWLDGLHGSEDAILLATTATHQYAKRQRTWFRNRMGDWPRLGLAGEPL